MITNIFGTFSFFYMFLDYIIQSYNDESFICSVAKTLYHKSINYTFWDYLSLKDMSSIIGEKNNRKLEDKLDIKNFIKL